MKVILAAKSVHPFHPFGGIQKYVYYFARHLAAQGVDVEIVAPLDGGRPRTEYVDGIKYTLIAPNISSYLELPIGWLGVHWFARNLVAYLKTQEFDILHSFDLAGAYYVRERARKPVVAHIFSDNYLCNPIGVTQYLGLFGRGTDEIKKTKIALSPFASLKDILTYPAQYFLKTKAMHRYLSACEGVFVEGEYFKDEVVNLFRLDASKVKVVPVGVDLQHIQRQLKATTIARERIGFLKGDLVLLTVNRLAADKGIDKIILSLKDIQAKVPTARLLVIGQGYQEKELVALIVAQGLQGLVKIVKDVKEDDLYGYYKISDLYICAFSFPGSSISTVEAMACGLPVITTAQPWLVKGNGTYIKGNDPATIERAVIDLACGSGDLSSEKAASIRLAQEYDWPGIVHRAKEYYIKVQEN